MTKSPIKQIFFKNYSLTLQEMRIKRLPTHPRLGLTARQTVVSLMFAVFLFMTGEPIDSLYIIYQNSPVPSKTQAANELFHRLKQVQFTDTLLQFGKNDKREVVDAHAHYWMAEYYYDLEEYEDALEAGMRGLELISHVNDDQFKSDLLGIVANAEFRLCYYDNALETLMRAYKIDKKLDQPELISSDFNTLAAIYLETKQPQEGIKCIEKSINIERKLNRPERLAIRLGMACELYLMNNEPDKAMAAINEAYQIDSKAGRSEKAAIRLSQKAAILITQAQLEPALQNVNKALAVLQQANNTYSIAVCHNQLGNIYSQMGNREKSLENYKKALEMSFKCGSPKTECVAERGIWENLRDTNPSVALLHLERYMALNDSLHDKSESTKLKAMSPSIMDAEPDSDTNYQRLFIIAVALLTAMLMLMLAGILYYWRKNKSAMKMFKQSQDLKNRLLSNITHELQTPLTVILGAGERLVEERKTSAEENRQLGEMINNHGNNMLHLINQLLNIDSVSTTSIKPDLKSGDIVMFVRLMVENYTDDAHQKLINLEFHSPLNSLKVIFTPNYLREFAHILIANAIKFTPRNGTVTVSLDNPEHNKMRLVVSDTGNGIPMEEQDCMFEPFSSKNYDDGGVTTGLELSLAYQLIKTINGEIKVDSEAGKGTTFTVVFPVQPPLPEDKTDSEEAPQFAEKRIRPTGKVKHKPLVFIVEDHDDIAFFIASHLRQDYELRFARDGREAFRNAQDLAPDLIITNIMMPVMDGKELMRKIRENASLSHIPIIALTSRLGEEERISCMQAGADVVLVKPFNSSELKLVAEHLITRCSIIREVGVKTSNDNNDSATSTMSKEDKEFINRLVSVIHAQMAKDDIDMEHIAAALSLSRKQLRTRVMAITGLTPVAYVLQVRLNYAHRMITTSDLTLTTIANKCGFQNLSHFSKVFKQQFGVSPLQFRKNIIDNVSPPQGRT